MKNLFVIGLFLLSISVNAQVKGNKKIITRNFEISSFEEVYIGLTAEYVIDLNADPSLEITMDQNLFEHIEKSVTKNVLRIDQIDWVKASGPIKVVVGGREMKAVTQSSHSRTEVRNIDQEKIAIDAEVGDMILQGKVTDLAITVGTADVYASALSAINGNFKFTSWGRIEATVSGNVSTVNNKRGKLVLNGPGNTSVKIEKSLTDDIRFIKFRLKNNSANRHQFYVEGPKPDGSSFSYGFPMMPLQKRDKDWTNGTKVYKVNRLGLKKLVKEIKLSDEGQVVNIF